MHKLTRSETVLEDDYPMNLDYVYIIDNQFLRSKDFCTVGEYKARFGVKEIRRCDLFSHPGVKIGDEVR